MFESVEDHRNQFEKLGVQLELKIEPGSYWVEADGSRLSQVAGNLLSNALKELGSSH